MEHVSTVAMSDIIDVVMLLHYLTFVSFFTLHVCSWCHHWCTKTRWMGCWSHWRCYLCHKFGHIWRYEWRHRISSWFYGLRDLYLTRLLPWVTWYDMSCWNYISFLPNRLKYPGAGPRATAAIDKLIAAGFNGTLYNGQGTRQWEDAGFPLFTTDSVVPPCTKSEVGTCVAPTDPPTMAPAVMTTTGNTPEESASSMHSWPMVVLVAIFSALVV